MIGPCFCKGAKCPKHDVRCDDVVEYNADSFTFELAKTCKIKVTRHDISPVHQVNPTLSYASKNGNEKRHQNTSESYPAFICQETGWTHAFSIRVRQATWHVTSAHHFVMSN